MHKLEERINKFLDWLYPNEWLWKRSLRFRTILAFVKWDKTEKIIQNAKHKEPLDV